MSIQMSLPTVARQLDIDMPPDRFARKSNWCVYVLEYTRQIKVIACQPCTLRDTKVRTHGRICTITGDHSR